jgi:hypothetical protein
VQSFRIDLQGVLDHLIARGQLLLLTDLRAVSLQQADQAVLWLLRGANPMPGPCLNAAELETCGQHLKSNGTFSFDATEKKDSFLIGSIADGRFRGGPDVVHISLPLAEGLPPVGIDLVAARGDIPLGSGGTIDGGRVGGALAKKDVDQALIPAVHGVVMQVVQRTCHGKPPHCCPAGSPGATILSLLDSDMDCQVSLDEFRNNPLVANMFSPDLDLFDAAGNLHPNQDGVKDSLSFGFSFDSVGATFPAPL